MKNVMNLISEAVNEYQKEKGTQATKEVYEFFVELETNGLTGLGDEQLNLLFKAMGIMLYKYGARAEDSLYIYNVIGTIIQERKRSLGEQRKKTEEEAKEESKPTEQKTGKKANKTDKKEHKE